MLFYIFIKGLKDLKISNEITATPSSSSSCGFGKTKQRMFIYKHELGALIQITHDLSANYLSGHGNNYSFLVLTFLSNWTEAIIYIFNKRVYLTKSNTSHWKLKSCQDCPIAFWFSQKQFNKSDSSNLRII